MTVWSKPARPPRLPGHRLGALALVLALPSCAAVEAQSSAEATVPAVVGASSVATIDGNAVELIPDGAAAAARIVAEITAARRSVEAEIYEFDRGDIEAALVAAARRGVRIALIYDPSVDVDAPVAARLAALGAWVRPYPIGPRQIDHVKLLVVDGVRAIFGGMNWGRRSYLNHDFDVAIGGPIAANLAAIFSGDAFRAGAADASRPGAADNPPPSPAGSTPGISIAVTYPGTAIRTLVLEAIAAARRYLFVEMYVLTEPAGLAALTGAAARGVTGWVLLDPGQDLNQLAAQRLRGAGVRAEFYRSHGEKLHAKAMVVDGARLVVGSANWTSSGLGHNHELDALIESPGVAAAALARMETDWRRAA